MPDRVRDRTGGAGDADFTHALDAQRIHVRIAFLDQDRFERGHIGVHGNVVLAQMGFNGRPDRASMTACSCRANDTPQIIPP